MTESSELNTIPILSSLQETGLDPQLKSLKNDPNILIKEVHHPEPAWTLGEVEVELSIATNLLQELDKFDLNVPSFGFFIGRDKNVLTSFCKRERIDGVSLWEFADHNPAKAREVLPKFFFNVTNYIIQCYNDKKPYLCDIFSPEQYIFGKRPNSQEEKVFLVDLDPLFYTPSDPSHDDMDDEEEEAVFFGALDAWCKDSLDFENQLQVTFTDVRNLLNEFHSSLQPNAIPFEISGFNQMRVRN